jgi:hypothetical protein
MDNDTPSNFGSVTMVIELLILLLELFGLVGVVEAVVVVINFLYIRSNHDINCFV